MYPDDQGIIFNETFLGKSENQLTALLPDFSPFAEVIRVINVKEETGGGLLDILMNAEYNRAVGMIVP